jgi:glycosyltransferase involved in cell wall biosynthesis
VGRPSVNDHRAGKQPCRRKEKLAMPPGLPFISVIMPTLNASKYLVGCLSAIKEQTYPKDKFEIIVVDNGSTDNSVQLSMAYADKVLQHEGVTISALRNLGARNSVGKILAFIDADCLPDKDWLSNSARYLSEHVCITGSKYELPEKANWIERVWFYEASQEIREVEYINAGNLIVPSELFFAIGGFDESLVTGEDCEFCSRGKRFTKVIANPAIRVVHLGNPRNIKEFIDREIWHGMGGFGNLKNKWFDKVLIGSVIFLILSFSQVAGLYYWKTTGTHTIFVSASLGLLFMIISALYYKGLLARSRWILQAILIFYIYFFSRAISLLLILLGIDYKKSRSTTIASKLST